MSSTHQQLSDFIRNRMRMAHIYQPVMLMELLTNGGESSVTEIAKALLVRDPSQIEYYEHITKGMVGRVLSENHGITSKEKAGNRVAGYRLNGFEELSQPEMDDLLDACQEQLDEYVGRRGKRIWQHRTKSSGYISGTVRYEVLKRAKFCCELCGISARDKALEVDHIVPRNHGGSDDISNLQALCYSCNAMKQDRDDTDFRGIVDSYEHREKGCIFCSVPGSRIVAENELAFAYRDQYPVTDGHLLLIPKRHTGTYFDLYQPEINAIHHLIGQMKGVVESEDPTVTGFNIGMNSGEDAGQTVMHCHVHLIPRRRGDIDNPRGGVRGVIPDKRIY